MDLGAASERWAVRGTAWRRTVIGAVGIIASLTIADVARGDSAADINTLRAGWSRDGLSPIQGQPRLFTHGLPQPLLLPPRLAATDSKECTWLAVLGAQSTSFTVQLAAPPIDESGPQYRSTAGLVQVQHCGAQRRAFQSARVTLRSPRAVVEWIAVAGPKALPSPRQQLLHRDPGFFPRLREPGARPVPAPLDVRVARVEAQAKRGGSDWDDSHLLTGSKRHSTTELLEFQPGCYEVYALGAHRVGPHSAGLDIDLSVQAVQGGALLGDDRSETADAKVSFCVGSATAAVVSVAGIGHGRPAALLRYRYPLAKGFPAGWHPTIRGRMAQAHRGLHAPALDEPPVFLSLGGNGLAKIPLQLDPTGCYLALLTRLKGVTRSINLRVQTRDAEFRSHGGGTQQQSASIGFCNRGDEAPRIDVEARGSAMSWFLGIWRVGAMPPGELP